VKNPELPGRSDCPSGLDLGNTAVMNRAQDKTDTVTDQGQPHEVYGSSGLVSSAPRPKKRASVKRRGIVSQPEDLNSQSQTMKVSRISVTNNDTSFFAVYE
jgi:hypothetical protein